MTTKATYINIFKYVSTVILTIAVIATLFSSEVKGIDTSKNGNFAIGFSDFYNSNMNHIIILNKNNDLLNDIKVGDISDYEFCYENNILKVFIYRSEIIYEYSNSGDYLSQHLSEIEGYKHMDNIRKNKICDNEGNVYEVSIILGYTKIYKYNQSGESELIYERGIGKYVFRCIIRIIILTFLWFFAFKIDFNKKSSYNIK